MISITLRKLRAVLLLLIHSFAKYVIGANVLQILLHSDCKIVVQVIGTMVSVSR